MENAIHLVLDTARGRIMLLTALMILFLVDLHLYRHASERSPRFARVLVVFGFGIVILVLADLFGLVG